MPDDRIDRYKRTLVDPGTHKKLKDLAHKGDMPMVRYIKMLVDKAEGEQANKGDGE